MLSLSNSIFSLYILFIRNVRTCIHECGLFYKAIKIALDIYRSMTNGHICEMTYFIPGFSHMQDKKF